MLSSVQQASYQAMRYALHAVKPRHAVKSRMNLASNAGRRHHGTRVQTNNAFFGGKVRPALQSKHASGQLQQRPARRWSSTVHEKLAARGLDVSVPSDSNIGVMGLPVDLVASLVEKTKGNPFMSGQEFLTQQVRGLYREISGLDLLETQVMGRQFSAEDISLGALRRLAHFFIHFTYAVVGSFLDGYTDEEVLANPQLAQQSKLFMSRLGEGGGITRGIDGKEGLIGKPGGGRSCQIATGGFGVFFPRIQTVSEVVFKIHQGGAKVQTGGIVALRKVLASLDTAIERGFVPEGTTQEELEFYRELVARQSLVTDVTSPSSFVDSVEENSQHMRNVLGINPNLSTIALKVAANMGDDWGALFKAMLTAVQSSGVKVRPEFILPGRSAGSGSTKHSLARTGHFIDFQLYKALSSEGAEDYNRLDLVRYTVSGEVVTPEQMVKMQVMRWMVGDDRSSRLLRFGRGSKLMEDAGCVFADTCFKHCPVNLAGIEGMNPDGTTVEEAGFNAYPGTPVQLVQNLLPTVKATAALYRRLGITNLDETPTAKEAREMFGPNGERFPFDITRVYKPGVPELVIPKTPPLEPADESVEKAAINKVKQAMSLGDPDSVKFKASSPAGNNKGPALQRLYGKLGGDNGKKPPLRVTWPSAGNWFGGFSADEDLTIESTGPVGENMGRFAKKGTIIGKDAGDCLGMQAGWGVNVFADKTGNECGSNAQGVKLVVTTTGNEYGVSARALRGTILGQASHYEAMLVDMQLQLAEFDLANNRLGEGGSSEFKVPEFEVPVFPDFAMQEFPIGDRFGAGATSLQTYMPQVVYDETLERGFFGDHIPKGHISGSNLSDEDCETLAVDIANHSREVGVPHVQALNKVLIHAEGVGGEALRNQLIRSSFCSIAHGPQFLNAQKMAVQFNDLELTAA